MSQPTTAFSIEGTVHKVFEMEQKGASFSVRNFVLEVAGQYPQLIQFQLTQDRCALIDKFSADEPIRVHFDLRGREWNGKYLTNLHAWKLDRLADEAPEPAENKMYGKADDAPAPANDTAEDIFGPDDDLPF
jgi:single-strand DNA-binding protein